MKEIARERGGDCISKRYVNRELPLRWRCARGHEWSVKPHGVVHWGNWCVVCAGKQKHTLADARRLARERGGRCTSTEYVTVNTPLSWRCARGHEWETALAHVQRGSWCPTCAIKNPITIDELRAYARSKGGECLSDAYEGVKVPVRWRCGEGHEWSAAASEARKGRWCRWCAGRRNDALDTMRAAAKERGGECLADRWERGDTPVGWRCAQGHEWRSSRNSVVLSGTWCPTCSREDHTRAHRWRSAARRRGGTLLTREPADERTLAAWRCARGHDFDETIERVLAGHWCERCAGEIPAGAPLPARVREWCRAHPRDTFTIPEITDALHAKPDEMRPLLASLAKRADTIAREKRGVYRIVREEHTTDRT
jgi:hypothetical protein